MPPSISVGDGATASEDDAKFVPVDTEASANTAQDATTPLDIAQPPPPSAMSRKRKASDFFEPEAKRVASEAVLEPSRELSRRDDATSDDSSSTLDSSDDGSTSSPSESCSETPSLGQECSDSSSSCSPDIGERGTQCEETSSSSQTPPSAWNEDEWLAILKVKARQLEEDYLGLKARERTTTAIPTQSMTQVSEALITEPNTPVNLTGARDGPPPQQWQTPPETQRWPVENVSVAEPEQSSAPLIKKHFSATEIHKQPNVPVFTEVDVEYTKRDDLWCAALGGFAVNERKELFIYDAPWASSRKWTVP